MSTNYRHYVAPSGRMHGLKVSRFVDLLCLLAALPYFFIARDNI